VQQVVGYCAGEGGCGKSYVLKCLVDFAEKHGAGSKVRVLAYTGSAAAGIGSLCATMHTGLCMPVHATMKTLNNVKRPEGQMERSRSALFGGD
jgi:ABC-type dipeptide/oligopeptide/nickel transport system ATPase component